MRCKSCGTSILKGEKFCAACGTNSLVGYSNQINDPRVAANLKKINQSGMFMTLVIAVLAVLGFSLAGFLEIGGFELPWAFFFGLGLGTLLLVLMLFQLARGKKDGTWDGVVVDKTHKKASYADRERGDYRPHYTVHIRRRDGKIKKLPCNEELYHYYQIGDHVRHHEGTLAHLLEKYDKSRDTIIYCIVCSTKNQIQNDICRRCKSPLMK